MLNHVTLLGRLAADPHIRLTQSGLPVASFDLAVNVPSKDRNTPPDYIPIVCWRERAEFTRNYLSKGRQIVVEGRLSTRKYTAQDGSNRKVMEVVADHLYFADSGNGGGNAGSPSTAPLPPTPDGNGFTEVDDDELPF